MAPQTPSPSRTPAVTPAVTPAITPAISPAIVVMAYDRPVALARLLASLRHLQIDGSDDSHGNDGDAAPVDLVISIDDGGANRAEVLSTARQWVDEGWEHGKAEVIQRPRLGLVDHFHTCGDLTERFGAVVLLEDDLTVGPGAHRWASSALTAAAGDDRIAGVSLSAPWFDGYRQHRFEPVLDGSDGFFLQVPWFHGMAWTDDMWRRYRSWRSANAAADAPDQTAIHEAFDSLDGDEWFPDAVRYLVATDRTYLFPRLAHATNHGDAGQHFDTASPFFHVPVQLDSPPAWHLLGLDESLAVYDDHMEPTEDVLRRLCERFGGPDLGEEPITVDLAANRDLDRVTTERIITTRPVTRAAASWGTTQRPLAMNVVNQTPGDGISLALVRDVDRSPAADRTTDDRLADHDRHGRAPRGGRFTRTVRDRSRQLVDRRRATRDRRRG